MTHGLTAFKKIPLCVDGYKDVYFMIIIVITTNMRAIHIIYVIKMIFFSVKKLHL